MEDSYLTIGELAKRAGVATSALRFYETKGLIASERTDGNQRRYHRATLRRVALIRAGQEVGLSLRELGDALANLPHDTVATKADWERLSRSWRSRLDAQIAERVGLKSIYLSGYSMALANGWPDMGFLTQTEVARLAGVSPSAVSQVETGHRGLAIDTLLTLSEVSNIVAVKDSTGDFDGMSRLIAESDLQLYCGDDWATFGAVCLGAAGVISVASHVAGERMAQMIELVEAGDTPGGRKIHEELLPLFRGLFITSNPIPLKAALALIDQWLPPAKKRGV